MIYNPHVDFPAVLLVAGTVAYLIYWFSVGIINRPLGKPGARRAFARMNLVGAAVLGGLPLASAVVAVPGFTLAQVGLSLTGPGPGLSGLVIAAAVVLIIPITYIATLRGGDPGRYPELRLRSWKRSDYLLWAAGWFIFLFAYEVMFRGVLFMAVLPVLGFPTALGLNLAVYSLSHIQKGLREAGGCLLMGTVLCVATAWSGTIWIAFWIHYALAIINGLWAIRSIDVG